MCDAARLKGEARHIRVLSYSFTAGSYRSDDVDFILENARDIRGPFLI
jgi:hypothetical protein